MMPRIRPPLRYTTDAIATECPPLRDACTVPSRGLRDEDPPVIGTQRDVLFGQLE